MPQAYHHTQMSQNMASYSNQMPGGVGQFDSNGAAIGGSQPVLASTAPVNPQNSAHPQHQQYNSTQPAPANHAAAAFQLNQASYQGISNAKVKNQKNYQAKV